MTPIERTIREQLGVPQDDSPVLILGMDAHMDWDWLNTFQTLVDTGNGSPQGSVQDIINQAWKLMIANPGQKHAYRYSVCEMGFLRAVLERSPDLITLFHSHSLNQQLSIEGGGITSPDNLLPHGEAFLRNYLVGWAWQQATLGLPTIYAYLPDDFGHDAQLPVMLEALGFAGVCFSRIPGSWAASQTAPLDGSPSLYQQLISQGVDLFWQAGDGSSVLAHLEQAGYQQGNSLRDYCDDPASALGQLEQWLQQNQPSSPSPYMYLPCGDDFALPIPCLLQIADAWNTQTPQPDTHVVVGTLEQYIKLVLAWSGAHPGKLVARSMDPTPYWTGYYASRPANKILHHATVRALLGAEVFGTIADLLQTSDALAWAPVRTARQQMVAQGWEALLPSTHHDYITGTAMDSVYTEEQLPLLRAAYSIAVGARKAAIQAIAPLIGATPGTNETPVAVFNQLGFAITGLVEMPIMPGLTATSVRSIDNGIGPVQTTPDGKLLFLASAPGLGYTTAYLSDQPGATSLVSAERSPDGSTVTLANAQMQLTLAKDQGWAITSLQPIVEGHLQPELVPTGQAANTLVFYNDQGNIYNFGNEFDAQSLTIVTGQLAAHDAQVIEQGPLRVRVQAQVTFSDGISNADYTIEYMLVAGEPFVRMAVTGAVPLPPDPEQGGTPYAVMVRFPFAGSGGAVAPVDGVLRGTPYHWQDQLPVAYWKGPTFQAAHHFVVPSSAGTPLAAVYHADVPAWAIDDSGALIGCILRNTPASYPWPPAQEGRGANGIDFGIHTRCYALRIPQGLELPPWSLSIFVESWSFATPLQGASINVPTAGVSPDYPVTVSFPTSFSLASITSGNALLTVAKAGQFNPAAMILRLYQPSNAAQTVTLSLAGYMQGMPDSSLQAVPVTALEQPIQGAQPLSATSDQVTFTMQRALATLAVTQEKAS
jgi:alpha-mannosidase